VGGRVAMKPYRYLSAITAIAIFGFIGFPQTASAIPCLIGGCTYAISESGGPFPTTWTAINPDSTTGTAGIIDTGLAGPGAGTQNVMNVHVSPFGLSTQPYLAVQANSSATYTGASSFNHASLFWGTVDAFNFIDFYSGGPGGTLLATVAGSDLSVPANGTTADLVSILFTGANFDTAVFRSDGDAFELANLNATPIPGTLALFASGLGVLGFVARSNRRKKKLGTAAA